MEHVAKLFPYAVYVKDGDNAWNLQAGFIHHVSSTNFAESMAVRGYIVAWVGPEEWSIFKSNPLQHCVEETTQTELFPGSKKAP